MSDVMVITGGAGGMGLATARILGRESPVVLADVRAERVKEAVAELTEAGIAARGTVCDVTDRGQVEALFDLAGQEGRIAAVVHTAGLSPSMGSAEAIVRVNALGAVHVADAARQRATPGFAVVLVASMAAHLAPRVVLPRRHYNLAFADPEQLAERLTATAERVPRAMRPSMAYSISKDFVVQYARRAVGRFGERGARILSVSPGTFDTEMGKLEDATGAGEMASLGALRRRGDPTEIAELLAFAAGPRASYLTGTDLLCDGGVVAGVTWRDVVRMARQL